MHDPVALPRSVNPHSPGDIIHPTKIIFTRSRYWKAIQYPRATFLDPDQNTAVWSWYDHQENPAGGHKIRTPFKVIQRVFKESAYCPNFQFISVISHSLFKVRKYSLYAPNVHLKLSVWIIIIIKHVKGAKDRHQHAPLKGVGFGGWWCPKSTYKTFSLHR